MRCAQRVYAILSLIIICSVYFISYKLVAKETQEQTTTKPTKSTLRSIARTTQKTRHDSPNTKNDSLEKQWKPPPGVVGNLQQIVGELVRLQREIRHPEIQHKLQTHIAQLRQAVEQLGATNSQLAVLNNNLTKVKVTKRKPDVCPEKYEKSDLSGGYPFFYTGFDMQKCKEAPPLPEVLSVVLNLVSSNVSTVASILTNIHEVNPGLNLIVAVNSDFVGSTSFSAVRKFTRFLKFSHSSPATDVWSALIQQVSTRYVFVGRDIFHFSWHSRLERLVRVVQDLEVSIAAGSFRYLDGQWSYGCEQTTLKNSTLAYTRGYDISKLECMMCDVIQGPFVALTSTFKEVALQPKMSAISGFETWFQELKLAAKGVTTCPDSMFFVKKQPRHVKKEWFGLAHHLKVEAISFEGKLELEFSCAEAGIACSKISGEALSHCCLHELSNLIKTFFRLCKESGSLCEMQEGTLLGAVKFNGLLPWERDADVTFHTGNFTAIGALSEKLGKAGYSLSRLKDPWCCVDGVKAGGVYSLASNNWNMEVYGQHLMDSEKLLIDGIPPTLIDFDGQLIATPASPGLFARNRYGHEIYQHAQHWMTLSQSSGWAFYLPGTFTKCENPGRHTCLDQYLTDGNLQFKVHYP